jgi:hypothetical protein
MHIVLTVRFCTLSLQINVHSVTASHPYPFSAPWSWAVTWYHAGDQTGKGVVTLGIISQTSLWVPFTVWCFDLPLIWVCNSGVRSLLREFDLNCLPCGYCKSSRRSTQLSGSVPRRPSRFRGRLLRPSMSSTRWEKLWSRPMPHSSMLAQMDLRMAGPSPAPGQTGSP